MTKSEEVKICKDLIKTLEKAQMTREKAITELSDIRAEYDCFDADEEPKYHALSMAIEAMKQPLNDDWEKYSDKLWKTAYERGKTDADKMKGEK